MKNLILIALLSTLSLPAFAASLVSTSITKDGSVFRTCGLDENGFGGPNHICFNGRISDVCSAIKKDQKQQEEDYTNGGHGYFVVKSCEANRLAENVALTYDRKNDYEMGEEVTHYIYRCDPNIACGQN